MKTFPKPKFKVGDVVSLNKTKHYKGLFGTITEGPTKCFKSESGLVTEETTIRHIKLPHEFDGETLVVHYPEEDFGSWIQKARTSTSVFCHYSYTVKTPTILSIFPESKLLKK